MDSELADLLFARLDTYAASVSLPSDQPNEHLQPPSGRDAAFLRGSILNVEPELLTHCGGASRHQWLFQVDAFTADGIGDAKARGMADDLRPLFPAGTFLYGATYRYQVTRAAFVATPVSVAGWLFVPVTYRVQLIR